MVADIRAPATERVGNRPSLHLPHRTTSRLYPIFERPILTQMDLLQEARNTGVHRTGAGDSTVHGAVSHNRLSLLSVFGFCMLVGAADVPFSFVNRLGFSTFICVGPSAPGELGR